VRSVARPISDGLDYGFCFRFVEWDALKFYKANETKEEKGDLSAMKSLTRSVLERD
jgi:hypothetical protein